MTLSAFQFLRPTWLLLLIPLCAAVYWIIRRPPGMRRWEQVVDRHLAPHVLVGGMAAARRLPALMVAAAGILAIGALAGPVWQKLPQPVFSSQDALVILLDLSQSMNAEDIKPSRLERARFKVADILERRAEGQTALLVYAAEAYTVSPLTDDTGTISAQLSALTTRLMPSQGSRADRALVKALGLMRQAGRARGEVLLVTDDVNAVRDGQTAAELMNAGFRVSVLGVGTAEGGPVPGSDGFLKRRDGSIVIPKLDRESLLQVATRGGGVYQDVTADNADIDRLHSVFQTAQPDEIAGRELMADVWREEGPWLLLPLLPLLALTFRRGILVVLAVFMLIPSMPASAKGLDGLWSRPDQRASRELEDGDAESAAELFRDPAWRAAAQYRAGQYDQAAETLSGLDSSDARYNLGNALARLGQYEDAIAAYDRALEIDPDHADAKFNRDTLLELLQDQQQSQQQESGEPGDEQQQDSQSDDQSDGEQQNADSGEQSDGEQQDADSGDQSESDALQAGEEDERQMSEEEKAAAAEADEAAAEQNEDTATQTAEVAAGDEPLDESELAVEQWLRRIPDDPGGLLRRKFNYQYRQQTQPEKEAEEW